MTLYRLLPAAGKFCQINTLRPRQNCSHFQDDIFKCIYFNENIWISIKITLKLLPVCPINNISALVQIMAWRRLGDRPLSEPIMVSLPTHICAIRPQWVNNFLLLMIRKVSDNIKYGNETLPATNQLGNLWVGHTTDGMISHHHIKQL